MIQKIKSEVLAICGVLVLVLLDQVSKFLAVMYLAPKEGGRDIILWEGVFRLQYLENRGAAFGVLQGKRIIFFIITVLILLGIMWAFHRLPMERRFVPMEVIAVFIFAGAVGNFVDRMRLGYVIDFFYFELINFPVFNVADIYVTCATILFGVLFLFYYKEEDLNRILFSLKRKGKE